MARKKKTDCGWVARIPGTNEASKLFIELSHLVNNRPLSNYVYAYYLKSGVPEAMDAAGYKRNSQNQHSAKDVYKFFEVNKMTSLLGIGAQSRSVGFSDKNGNPIDFDAVEAYSKAQDFNNNNKGRVAYVVSNGDKFNIIIDNKDSRTQVRESEVNRALTRWQTLSDEFTKLGLDINEVAKINPQLINPGNISNLMKTLRAIALSPNDALSPQNIELLLSLEKDSSLVRNLMSRGWGTLAETTQRVYDTLHSTTAPQGQRAFITNVLDSAKAALNSQQNNIRTALKATDKNFDDTDTSFEIQKILKDLDQKYGIETDVYLRKVDKITRVSEAMADAVMSLERQIRNIEQKSGITEKSEELRALQKQLLSSLKEKKNAAGLADFLNTSVKYLGQINNILQNIPTTETGLTYVRSLANAITQATGLQDAYSGVVNSLTKIDTLVNDVALTDADKRTLQDLAISLQKDFETQKTKIDELSRTAMVELGSTFIGEHNALYGKDLSTVIDMLEADASIMDYFYSVGRVSNTFISIFGALARDAQLDRDNRLLEISHQIRSSTNKLYKSGSDSAYIYDDKGRIVSPYDWDEFYKQRGKYIGQLKRAGFRPNTLEFNEQMEEWEKQNTREIEVDHLNHRFERVPIDLLPYDFQEFWTQAQIDYYNEMMEIKGQIGTLLPSFAQHQFLAPQKRANWDEFLKDLLLKRKSFKDVARGMMKLSAVWKIHEDDIKFRANGIYVEDEMMTPSTSAFDNTVLRQIPIFYVRKVELNDLSHDFSAALQSLASTALNYDAMDSIKNIADLMVDYANSNSPLDRDGAGNPKVDLSVRAAATRVASMLRKKAGTDNTTTMLESFVQKQVYGLDSKETGPWAVVASNLIGLTSFRGLATNPLGAMTNRSMGIIQAIIRATGGQYFNIKDLTKAFVILTGEQGLSTRGALMGGVVGGFAGAPGLGAAIGLGVGTALGARGMTAKFVDIVTGNRESKDTLIAEFFDPSQEMYSSLAGTRYHSTMFGRLFGHTESTAMYQRGEYWIHMLNAYALLEHEKVIKYDPDTGKRTKVSLLDVLEKGESKNGVADLKLADGVFRIDGKKIESLQDDYFKAIKRRLRYINQQCHGSMNKEDKGLIHQWMLGRLAMNFRQWMVEHYSSRFRGLHWDESIRDVNLSNFYQNTKVLLDGKEVSLIDALEMVDDGNGDGSFHYEIKADATTLDGRTLTDEEINSLLEAYADDAGWRRGFKTSTFNTLKLLRDFLKDGAEYENSARAFWDTLSETQRADVKQTLGEYVMLLALMGLNACMGKPDDHDDEFYFRVWMYVVKRCLFDERATTIPGLISESKTIMQSPIPAAKTAYGLLYPVLAPILSPQDLTTRLQSGRHKGELKYWRNIVKYTLPVNIHKIEQFLNLGEDSAIFNTFEDQITR